MYTAGSGPSASQFYNLSGTNLTAGTIAITGSTNYDVSTDDSNFGNTASLTVAAGTLTNTPVYVRLKAGLGVNNYNGESITNVGAGSSVTVTANGSVTPAPGLTVSSNSLTGFTTVQGTPSAAQTYLLTSTGISTDVTVTAPAGYQVAQGTPTTPGTYASVQTVTSANAVAGRTIYVRLAAATTAGSYAGNVTNESGTYSQNVAVSGTVTVPAPTITVSPTTALSFTTTEGTTSTPQTYNVSGANLTAAIIGTAPSGYEVALESATVGTPGVFGGSFTTAAPSGGIVGTTRIYVRLTGAAAGSYGTSASPLNIVHTSTGVSPDVNKPVYGTVNPTPVLTVAPTALTGFSTIVGTASASQQYTLTGASLSGTGSVTVTAPSGYELAVTAGGTYNTTLTISQANATAGQSIFVRLAASAAVNAYGTPAAPLNITNEFAGAITKNVAVDGTVLAPTPAIAVNPSSLSGFTATVGSASAAQSYIITPTGLSAAVTVTAPAGYEVSLATGTGYAGSVTAAQTGNTTIYVRLAATTAVGAYSGNVTNVSGTVSQPVAVSGSVSPAPVAGGPGLLVLEEDFDYPTGTVLTSTPNWNQIAGVSTTPVTVSAASLTFNQYGSPARIGAAVSVSDGQDVERSFSVPAATTDYYVSALVRVNRVATDYFLSFIPSSSATSYIGRLYTRTAGSQFNFGTGYINTSTSSAVYSSTAYNVGTTYLVVLHYIKNPGVADDQIELYVLDPANGVPLTMPATPSAVAPVSNSGVNPSEYTPSGIALRQATTAQTILVDGIRVGTGWGSVVGRPVYTTASSIINPGYYYDVTLNNADALTLSGPATIENKLTLTSGIVNTTDVNLLTLVATADVAASPSNVFGPLSFVSGPLARQTPAVGATAATFMFPVGKGTNYRPLTLSVTNQPATTYTAEQREGAPSASTLPAGVTRVSGIRYYSLTPNAQPVSGNAAFQAQLTIPFSPNDYVNDPATLVMVKRATSAAAWENIGNSATIGISTIGAGDDKRSVAGSLTSATFTSFSDFSLATTNADPTLNPLVANAGTPLPVELSAFSAQRQASSNAVNVKWTTASEKNSARFEVQRSLDGREFATVATASAQGNTSQTTVYALLDKTAPTAKLYYRLRQVDRDGTVAFSPVATVAGGTSAPTEWALYPNPATDRLTLALPAAEGRTYRLLNTLGQVVAQGTATSADPAIDVRQLAAGTYFLELHTATGPQTRRFVKAN